MLVIIVAPSFSNLFVPFPFMSQISCGSTNTFLSCSLASFAVTLVPLLNLASITNIPIEIPLTILFLSKNFLESALVSGGYSLITAPPFFIISLYNDIFCGGNILSNPFPSTAIVFPSTFSVALCEHVSIPFC